MTEVEMVDRALRIRLLVAGALVTIALLGAVDLFLDAPDTRSASHALVELLFIGVCLATAVYFGLSWRRSETSLANARVVLAARRVERDAWRARAETAIRGLAEAIDAQLTEWGLTPAERETAFLLLKGFTHREIAAVCNRSERTVRQHAVSVYRKSGLSGRAGLSAFFLEDLLVPAATGRGGEAAGSAGAAEEPRPI